jgi:RimJ/RimL family protein N-acetyltransferase
VRQIITDDRVHEFVCARLGSDIQKPYTCLGVEDDGEIIGGVVFDHFCEHDVELSVAGEPRAWTKAFFARVRDYVFSECGYLRLTFVTEQPSVAELAMRLGARIEGRKRNHFGKGRDAVLLGILKEEWALNG